MARVKYGLHIACLVSMFFFTLFIVYVHVHLLQNVCRGQKITFESWFFPSTEWVLGIELRP